MGTESFGQQDTRPFAVATPPGAALEGPAPVPAGAGPSAFQRRCDGCGAGLLSSRQAGPAHCLECAIRLSLGEPLFRHTECDRLCTQREMIEANAHDADVCEWLRTAKVGERFGCFTDLRRVI